MLEPIQAQELRVPAVDDVVGARLGEQDIEAVDIVQRPVGDIEKRGNAAPEIEEGVELDRPLVGAKPCPGEERQAQLDGRRIERIHGGGQLAPERLVGVKVLGDGDESLREVGVDLPVAPLVGIGQGAARDAGPDAHVVQLGLHHPGTGFDVAQVLAVGQLGEGQADERIEAGEETRFEGRNCFRLYRLRSSL